MPFIRGPSIIFRGRGYFSRFNLASSVSSTMCFSMPLKEKKERSKGREQQKTVLRPKPKNESHRYLEHEPQISQPESESLFHHRHSNSLSFGFLTYRNKSTNFMFVTITVI